MKRSVLFAFVILIVFLTGCTGQTTVPAVKAEEAILPAVSKCQFTPGVVVFEPEVSTSTFKPSGVWIPANWDESEPAVGWEAELYIVVEINNDICAFVLRTDHAQSPKDWTTDWFSIREALIAVSGVEFAFSDMIFMATMPWGETKANLEKINLLSGLAPDFLVIEYDNKNKSLNALP